MPASEIPLNSDAAANFISRSVIPIGITLRSDAMPWEKTIRATASLIRLAERDVFVTNCHVWEEFKTLKALYPDARIVGYWIDKITKTLVIIYPFNLIDKERTSLDVAIFRGQENRILIPRMRFIEYDASYLPDPRVGEPVIIVGYPAANIEVNELECNFGYVYLVLRCSSVSDRQISCVDERRTRIFVDYFKDNSVGIVLGGLSGSAAYILRDRQLRFAGIVTECSDTSVAADQTICVARLGCINPDGTLDHASIPW